MTGDRINESYRGLLGAGESRRTRARIHWICRQVEGDRVLDVGCSQGIVSILLGREGFRVVGVDSDPEAIEFATAELEKEPQVVRDRVQFQRARAEELDPAEHGEYDCLILGEVLEHLAHPGSFLARVVRLVRPGGRVVLTTPFGLHEHPDHKQTFYPGRLLQEVGPTLVPLELEVEGRYILLTGQPRGADDPPFSARQVRQEVGEERLIQLEQAAMERRERDLAERLAESQQKRTGHYAALERERARVAELTRQAAAREAHREELERRLEESAQQVEAAAAELQSCRRQLAEVETESAELRGRMEQVARESERWSTRLEGLRSEQRESAAVARRAVDLAVSARREAEEGVEEMSVRLLEETESKRSLAAELERERQEGRRRMAALGTLERQLEESRQRAEQASNKTRKAQEKLRAVRSNLETSQRKRAGHYRNLQAARAEIGRLEVEAQRLGRALHWVLDGRRFQLGAALVKAGTSLRGAVELPGRLLRLLRRATAPPAPEPPAEQAATAAPARRGTSRRAAAVPRSSTNGTEPGAGSSPGDSAPAVIQGVGAPSRAVEAVTDLRVAAILDEMSSACFAPDCRLISFSPSNWRRVLEQRQPDLLFVESAWQGNEGSWQYKVGTYDHPDSVGLEEVVAWCRQRGVPTAFWNKEDPVHFEKFKRSAALFDHVFTTDSRMVERYRELPGNPRRTVEPLLFAAQPAIHHPSGAVERSPAPCFAGSYYATRHESRRRKMEMLLDAARRHDLVIYDRNHGKEGDQYLFPERFRSHVRGGVPYRRIPAIYRAHRVFLNVNSVEGSPTMLSRRVFELLACGTAVVSTPSTAIEELFGELVMTAEGEEELGSALERLLMDDAYWLRLTRLGWRRVHSTHTYEHRLLQIAARAGLTECRPRNREVSALVPGADAERAAAVAALVAGLSRPPERTIFGVKDEASRRELEEVLGGPSDGSVRVAVVPRSDSREALADLAALAGTPWVTVLDPRHRYDEHFLEDLRLCTGYARADIIGSYPEAVAKVGDAPGSREHCHVETVHPEGCLIRRDLVAEHGWSLEEESSRGQQRRLRREGAAIYAGPAGGFRPRG